MPIPGRRTAGPSALLAASLERRRFLRLGAAGTALGALGLTGLVQACGSPDGPSTATGSGGGGTKVIGISLNVANAYSSYVAEGVYQALKGGGYDARIAVNNANSTTELTSIQNLVSAGIAGLVVLPVNADTAANAAKLCAGKGIPCGIAQWPTKTADAPATAIAWADWTQKGRDMGEYIKAHARPGKLIVVQAILGQQYTELIDAGLDESLAGSGFTVAVREQGFYDRTKATNIVQSGLQAHPDATGILTYAASMGDGVAQYLQSIKKSDVVHVSSDCDEEMLTWLRTPYLAATSFHSAAQSGLLVAQAVRTKIEGGSPTFLNELTLATATGDNIGDVIATTPFEYPEFAGKVTVQ
ncbi:MULTISPECIES: sugar ABC transporter substrate-binding protein [Pseudonocardia]|jgi:ribose transport system substrate-binding protein|uniref:Periplasmic binding protein domain-containing protein n=1 Tax=Pseudonocardia dioxanivorans (strain ATCC 55486 / DSM 44775 / JCM 13855 / CB1190) TaxID=675635 RepID=F4CUJ5_PSEUX|nr:sugar ABC transporter substrate-binding protein [Pseudonocardia dioxanivorans]AEA25385.1 hypothetical protein Psed_3189 [Pseudonocardia dioxanivorans CB1190]GJF02351.1 hypothetical protein PSD17_13140 [Pseudonocardia sp. D17]